jgi:integrase
VTPPSVKKYRGNVYDAEDIWKLFKAVENTELELPTAISCLSGLRRGEVLGLRWSDVDLKNCTITVSQQLLNTSEGLIFCSPKSEESQRTIKVPGLLLEFLKKQRKQQMDFQSMLGELYKKNNLVCCHQDGSPLHPSTLTKKFAKVLKENNLKHIRFHDLRHSNATLMLKANIPPKVASKMLGHSTVGITMDLYSHVLESMQSEATNAIDQLFTKSKKDSDLIKERA